MAVASGKSFIALLERSGIVAPQDLDSALERLDRNSADPSQELESLQRHLVESGLITEWHCEKLTAGKYKGFFLGKYKLLRHLGTGGMSTVYLAENKITGQKRAIKVLPRKKVSNKSFLERFYREARAAAALNHPNIVRVYDISDQENTHYMVMEYVEGIDLYALVKREGPLPFDEALRYVRQAAKGLQHAHDRNLIHRDIKPANLLLSENGQVKILDLGLALLAAEDEESLTVMHNERVMGTADYLSPEQAVNSHEVDQRTDLYSLGCTLYFLLTGQPPFPQGTLAQRIAMHQTREPEAIAEIRKECPAAIAQFCQRMMQKKPEDRFSGAAMVISEIDNYLECGEFPETGGMRGQFDFDVPDRPTETTADSIVVTQTPERKIGKRAPSSPNSNRPVAAATPDKETGKPVTRNKLPVGLSLSLVTLSLLVIAILVVAVLNFTGQTGEPAAANPTPDTGQTATVAAPTNQDTSWNSLPDNGPTGGGQLSGNRTGLTMADLVAGSGEGTTKLITFESDHFLKKAANKKKQIWVIRHNNQQIGTLAYRGEAEVIEKQGAEGRVLHILGDSDQVVFRPTNPSNRLRSIEFSIKLERENPQMKFMVQAKSLRVPEDWEPIYPPPNSDKQELSSSRFTPVKIDSFDTIDAQKFRFKLDGPVEDGVFIDNLKVELAQ
ncbi:MAG: serine/threonine protein kinase [Mariniblastus sp.]|nr:serine/threonine protein kinase [Mariniblastus sp.]